MTLSSRHIPPPSKELCSYLRREFGLDNKAIELGIRQSRLENAPLPIILLNYGMLTINDFQTLLDWQMDKHS